MKKIQAVSRGKDKGAILSPHRFAGEYYLITKGRNSSDYNRKIFNEDELESWVQKGCGIRMSAPGHPPSTFMPKSLIIILDRILASDKPLGEFMLDRRLKTINHMATD